MNEPKDAVRDVLQKLGTGSTSGMWLTRDPRPSIEYIGRLAELIREDREAGYDQLISIAEKAQAGARVEYRRLQHRVYQELVQLAEDTDSYRMHLFAESIKRQLDQN